MFKTISKLLTKFSNKVLNIEDQEFNSELSNILKYTPKNLSSKDLTDFLYKLKDKHFINDIIITDLDGIVIASTNKDLKEGFKSAAMYNYINSEINNLSIILIEANNGWQIIFKKNKRIYFLKANDRLTKIEVNAIILEIENFIKCIV
jgi:hypothetical protein